MPITLSVPQGDRELEGRLLHYLTVARRQLPYDADWAVLVWRTQDAGAWNLLVRGPTATVSEQLDDLDERIIPKLLQLLLRTTHTPTADRKAG